MYGTCAQGWSCKGGLFIMFWRRFYISLFHFIFSYFVFILFHFILLKRLFAGLIQQIVTYIPDN